MPNFSSFGDFWISKPELQCDTDIQFQCRDQKKCIPLDWVCDGEVSTTLLLRFFSVSKHADISFMIFFYNDRMTAMTNLMRKIQYVKICSMLAT